jgi:tyrosinase
LTTGTGITPVSPVATTMAGPSTPPATSSALIGANDHEITVGDAPVQSSIAMPLGGPAVAATTAGAAANERVFLNVEGVRGLVGSGVLNVTIGAPNEPGVEPVVKTVVFFGLANATTTEGAHAGNGLSATVEVTDDLRRLEAAASVPLESLDIRVSRPEGISGPPITVERLSLYRQRIG